MAGDWSEGGGRRSGWALRRALLTMAWTASPRLCVANVAILAVRLIVPVALIFSVGRAVDAVVPAVDAGPGSAAAGHLTASLLVVGLLFAVSQATAPLVDLYADRLGLETRAITFRRTLDAVLAPTGIRHLEDPARRDAVSAATSPSLYGPRTAVRSLVNQTASRVGAVAGILAVATYDWRAGLLLVAGVLVDMRVTHRRFVSVMAARGRHLPGLRRADYLRDLALAPGAEKELRVFGFGDWLVQRFRREWGEAMEETWRVRRGIGRDEVIGLAALGAALAIVGWTAVHQALDERIGLGELAIVLQGLFSAPLLAAVTPWDSQLEIAVGSVDGVLDLEAALVGPDLALPGDAPPGDRPRREVRFEGVSFSYPGRERPVFEGLDLLVPAGSSLAIVGENGAGKTTLVKLLCRLYDPSSGRITVDGVDLTALDAAAWQRRTAVIFQDFVRYPWTVADNVALSGCADPEALRRAADLAGAADVVSGLVDGWDTVLSRAHGGTDLSGGQWQRIALMRALVAAESGAPILVLDEPTAHLDVRQEAAFYDRFLDVTHGRTVVVISHRFSTVRRADRIVVLEHGRVIEQGTHDDLVAACGRYAEMFQRQAAHYADEDPA